MTYLLPPEDRDEPELLRLPEDRLDPLEEELLLLPLLLLFETLPDDDLPELRDRLLEELDDDDEDGLDRLDDELDLETDSRLFTVRDRLEPLEAELLLLLLLLFETLCDLFLDELDEDDELVVLRDRLLYERDDDDGEDFVRLDEPELDTDSRRFTDRELVLDCPLERDVADRRETVEDVLWFVERLLLTSAFLDER